MNRIVCVGNPYREGDQAGTRVFARLGEVPVPRGLEVVDGGLAGLDLLKWMEGARRVVFVDSVRGFAEPGTVVVVDSEDACFKDPGHFDHASGLSYLFAVYKAVLDSPPVSVMVVGVEEPADMATIGRAAELALGLALEGADAEEAA